MVYFTKKYRRNNTRNWQSGLRNYSNTRKKVQKLPNSTNVLARMKARGALNMNNNDEINRLARERRNKNLATKRNSNKNIETKQATNNLQKKYNAELASHQANMNLAAAKWAEYNANLQKTRSNLYSLESNYAIAKEKANRANLSNAERIKAETARNNLQRQLNSERKNMNNAYSRGAQLQNNHNKAVRNLENSSQQLVNGYNEHLRIVEEKDNELKQKQNELDAALLRASRANASNAERNNALENVKNLQNSVGLLTDKLTDSERIRAQKEDELQKQHEFMEEEYKRGVDLWNQKQEEISDLERRLASASEAEQENIQKALDAANAASEAAEKSKREFESQLDGLTETLRQSEIENEKKLKEIDLLNKNLADEKAAAAAAAAAASATFDQLKKQQSLNKNASNAEKKQMQRMLENALAESNAKEAKLQQIKNEQDAARERERLLQLNHQKATGSKLNSIINKVSALKKNVSSIIGL